MLLWVLSSGDFFFFLRERREIGQELISIHNVSQHSLLPLFMYQILLFPFSFILSYSNSFKPLYFYLCSTFFPSPSVHYSLIIVTLLILTNKQIKKPYNHSTIFYWILFPVILLRAFL